ncbi:MAG TPA: FAD-dependent oxidoreductase [Candidatus Baltobacteraceae bacterium]|nr:FAD-dependent oxidoreductase [Candidatus Baltobacteraceae bacterium]
MVTPDEICAIPLFAGLADPEIERLVRRSADLRVQPGEYIVHEGDTRALFIVLAGEIEVRKSIDGIEQTIGHRSAGDVIGEVPIALGTDFLASFRAASEARVMRIETRDFHAVAAAHPEVSARVGALASDRISGLEDLASKESGTQVIVVGDRYDRACRDLRTFLDRNGVSFEWVTPDDSEAETRIPGFARIRGRLPAVALQGGSLLLQPERRELANRLGLTTVPTQAQYDTVIIGGGPAGLAAAVYGASEGLSTLMIEVEAPGGQAGTSSRIENYLGFPTGVSGDELARRALAQAKRFGAEILVTRRVVDLDPETRELELDANEVVCPRTVILATGVSWRKLAVDGVERLTGKGVYYGASRSEASSLRGLDVYLIGAGNSAGQAALYFSGYARAVTLIVRGPNLERSMSHYLIAQLRTKPNVQTRLNAEVTGVYGEEHLDAIDITSDGTTERLDAAALYIFIGADAETAWLPNQLERDKLGYILTGDDVPSDGRTLERSRYFLETSIPGVFAAGDVRSRSIKRVAAGVGEGSMAIAFVHQFLQTQ